MSAQTITRRLILVVLLGIFVFAIAALIRRTSLSGVLPSAIGPLKPIQAWTRDLALQDADLPLGWDIGRNQVRDDFDGSTHIFWFEYVGSGNPPAPNLNQEFGIFSTTLTAEQSFARWVDKTIPPQAADKWKDVPELAFSHHADQLKIACLHSFINGLPHSVCSAIARYQNVLVIVRGIVYEGQWLTMADFKLLLEAADQRIASVLTRQE